MSKSIKEVAKLEEEQNQDEDLREVNERNVKE